MRDEPWEKIEDKFRWWSFRLYYRRTFAAEPEPHIRFVKAILASAAPIQNRRLVLDWYANRRRNRRDADATTLSTACR